MKYLEGVAGSAVSPKIRVHQGRQNVTLFANKVFAAGTS